MCIDCCVKIPQNKKLTPLRIQETFFTSKIKQINKQDNKKENPWGSLFSKSWYIGEIRYVCMESNMQINIP